MHESKSNVEDIQALMAKVSHKAFITRKKGSTLLFLADIEESVARQRTLITDMGEEIHKLLQVNHLTHTATVINPTGSHCSADRKYCWYSPHPNG